MAAAPGRPTMTHHAAPGQTEQRNAVVGRRWQGRAVRCTGKRQAILRGCAAPTAVADADIRQMDRDELRDGKDV